MSGMDERDFSNFELGDNVYKLADEVIPDIAELLGVAIAPEPNSADLQVLMGKVGRNKVLRDNEEITAIDTPTMAGLVQRSGVQSALKRSLWTPTIIANTDNVDAVVIMGGMANWQDRVPPLVEDIAAPIHVVTGNRIMDKPTEKPNPNVARMFDQLGRYPTETEYAAGVIVPRLTTAEKVVQVTAYDTDDGDEIFRRLVSDNQGLLESRLAVARVANAGVVMATQLRTAARAMRGNFDATPSRPQILVITDSFPLAETDQQVANAAAFQNPATALRMLVLTALKLHEAAQE